MGATRIHVPLVGLRPQVEASQAVSSNGADRGAIDNSGGLNEPRAPLRPGHRLLAHDGYSRANGRSANPIAAQTLAENRRERLLTRLGYTAGCVAKQPVGSARRMTEMGRARSFTSPR
jgi:hypothetical protein